MSLSLAEVMLRAADAPLDPPPRNCLNAIARAPLVIAELRMHEGAAGHRA